MNEEKTLERYIGAQKEDYQIALSEVKKGRKENHWMWYIFPQIKGLGFSKTSEFYAIKDLNEAEEFLNHSILGRRLIFISNELLQLKSNDATKIFGHPDDLKLKSSMTLFSCIPDTDPVFQLVLDKFFNGTKDNKTLEMIDKQQ